MGFIKAKQDVMFPIQQNDCVMLGPMFTFTPVAQKECLEELR